MPIININKYTAQSAIQYDNAAFINRIDVRNINEKQTMAEEFVNICQQYEQDQRWVLMIDPQAADIAYLSENKNINLAKILRVSSQKVKLDMANIKTTLAKGNCSAIILCNATLAEHQLLILDHYAKLGNTQCIILKNTPVLH